MFSFSKKRIGPIAIDFGQTEVRLTQMEFGAHDRGGLIAAASLAVPHEIKQKAAEMDAWYATAIKSLLNEGGFKGKKCVTAIPGKELLVQHFRIARQDPTRIDEKLPIELEGKLPFSPQGALLRHIVAGEVYQESTGEPKLEVIVMAAPAGVVHRYLRIIQNSHLMIETVTTESSCLMKAFAASAGEQDEQGAYMLVDLGYGSTRVLIASGRNMEFGRTIPLSYGTLQRALMKDQGITAEQSDNLIAGYGRDEADAGAGGPVALDCRCALGVDQHIQMLVSELQHCIRYHEQVFVNHPVERVIFVGGLVKHLRLCETLAQGLSLPAQIGDPIAAVLAETRKRPPCLRDERAHSEWAVAYGMALPS